MDPYHANWQPPMEETNATRGVELALLVEGFKLGHAWNIKAILLNGCASMGD